MHSLDVREARSGRQHARIGETGAIRIEVAHDHRQSPDLATIDLAIRAPHRAPVQAEQRCPGARVAERRNQSEIDGRADAPIDKELTASGMDDPNPSLKLSRGIVGTLVVVGSIAGILMVIGRRDFPNFHTILDTGMCLLSGVLALLLWEMGARSRQPFPTWLAIGFAVTFLSELVHVSVTVEWSGAMAGIAQAASFLRPTTWPPAALVLPIAVGGAIWLRYRDRRGTLAFALVVILLGAALFKGFQWLPAYTQPAFLGITRPALIMAPLLWGIIALASWRLRSIDRLMAPLTLMAAVLFLAHAAMLYSQAPHDTEAMVAHLGKIGGYLVLLLSLMHLATLDMLERIRAEQRLAALNDALEQRVVARTSELQSANLTLEGEVAIRRQAEQKAQAQLERLGLLQQITRAIGERQDVNSIFQVAVQRVEDQLPVDFACLCLYDRADHVLTVACIGAKSIARARDLAMPERARIDIDENGLLRCVRGQLVYEQDISEVSFPFPRRLARAGFRSLVIAPLQVESEIFGVLVVARVRAQGFTSGECEFLRQLSEHTALAAHQAQLNAALQQAYDDLRQAQQAIMQQERLRALGQMASGIAHDINNAVSPAVLYTESILTTEPDLSARARSNLEIVRRALEDVEHTVGRMREFYRQNEPQLAMGSVQPNTLVQQVLEHTRARWRDMPMQRGIVIRADTELASEPPAIVGVESEIREALINLVLNAVDAMPGGGTLTLRTRIADGEAASAPAHVEIEVADSGAGMDEDTRRRCLEPFFTTKGERGTGLGLAMVYGIARRHGAELQIDSAPGQGTTVRLSFPAFAGPAVAASEGEPAPALPIKMRLLLVDDDALVLNSLRDTLEMEGHVVVIANGGQAGIEAFHAAQKRGEGFDAVITDLGMPYLDGRKVAVAIKDASPATPVILLTGWGQQMNADSELPAHVDQVLSKPPRLRNLREALARCSSPPGV